MLTIKEVDIKTNNRWIVEQYHTLKDAMYEKEYAPILIKQHMRQPVIAAISSVFGDVFVKNVSTNPWRQMDTDFYYAVFVKSKKPSAKDYEVIRAIVQSVKIALS